MAALMTSPPGPIPISQYNGGGGVSVGSGGAGGGGGGGGARDREPPTSPRQQQPPPQSVHSALRSPTSEQQTRPQRTVRVQQPPGSGNTAPAPESLGTQPRSRPGTSAGAGGGSGAPTQPHRSSRQSQSASGQNQGPTSQPTQNHSRSGGNPSNHTNNPSSRPEPPPRESSQSRSTTAATANGGAGATTSTGNNRNSAFPHAFERWEMLSSRWEGLTGYWISKLEQNRHELSHLPLEQQMSRQITDLSAAGANLFHAVVELQKLRASSERKFQRWFFETRADQERSREMSSELEATLRIERQKRADAMSVIDRLEKEKSKAEKLVEEFRRELQISREECRRSWEELGRREQEERERRSSLREGNPTLVGDYQVLPVPISTRPGGSSGSGATPTRSRQQQRDDDDDARLLEHHQQQQQFHHDAYNQQSSHSPLPSSYNQPQGSQYQQRPGTSAQAQKPFYQSSNPNMANQDENRPYSPGAESFVTNEDLANQPSYPASPVYETSTVSPAPQRRRRPDSVTETDMSDEEAINTVPGGRGGLAVDYQRDEKGDLVLDTNGDPIIVSYRHTRIDPEEGGVYSDYDGWGGAMVQAPLPPSIGQSMGGVGGYGSNTGWEGISRHHHPTRLSDVVEEEERTHTSGSERSHRR